MQEGQDRFRDPTSIATWKPIPVLGTSDVPMLIRPFLSAGLDRVLWKVTVPDHSRDRG